jgi:hypothetical protein
MQRLIFGKETFNTSSTGTSLFTSFGKKHFLNVWLNIRPNIGPEIRYLTQPLPDIRPYIQYPAFSWAGYPAKSGIRCVPNYYLYTKYSKLTFVDLTNISTHSPPKL